MCVISPSNFMCDWLERKKNEKRNEKENGVSGVGGGHGVQGPWVPAIKRPGWLRTHTGHSKR